MSDWKIYGAERADGKQPEFPAPPPWRDFGKSVQELRGRRYRPPEHALEVVNAAIHLARPILVTGDPGTGKSSLAYSIAEELSLGRVLAWPINSRSSLAEGLYQYDAIGRMREARIAGPGPAREEGIGRFLKLGPLGTAFAHADARPRVVLIDEIDKSDVDLPNDLLHVFENGEFEIPELARLEAERVEIGTSDGERVTVQKGQVKCPRFPIVVLTSNGERELAPAFLRRCLRLDVPRPDRAELTEIAALHLPELERARLEPLLDAFEERRERGILATDQLLNAFFLLGGATGVPESERERLVEHLLRELGAR